jgi:sugar (pentulose or hexulose) kinase
LWRGILADVFGEPFDYVAAPERTAVGSALMAGITAGVYADYGQASEAARPPLVATQPDPARTARYDDAYARYSRLSALLLEEGRV